MVKALFGKYEQKSSNAKKDDTLKETSSNIREPCSEKPHDDLEEITPGKFPWPELFPLFAGKIDSNTMNIFTSRIMSNSHHIKGEGAKSKKSFLDFKTCFCLEWILVNIKGVPYWVRCGNMFNLYSQGCFIHARTQYKDGPNRLYYQLEKGRSGNWGMIKNKYLDEVEAEPTEEQKMAEAQAAADAIGEQMAVASQKGEDIKELQIKYHSLMQVIAKLRKNVAKESQDTTTLHQHGQSKAAQPASAQGYHTKVDAPPIYSSRRKAGISAPGNLVLDKKRAGMNDSNNKYKSNAYFSTLANISEGGQNAQQSKPKKKKN
jgi:hypothetical protein